MQPWAGFEEEGPLCGAAVLMLKLRARSAPRQSITLMWSCCFLVPSYLVSCRVLLACLNWSTEPTSGGPVASADIHSWGLCGPWRAEEWWLLYAGPVQFQLVSRVALPPLLLTGLSHLPLLASPQFPNCVTHRLALAVAKLPKIYQTQ